MATAVAACAIAGLVVGDLDKLVKAGPRPWPEVEADARTALDTHRASFEAWATASMFHSADAELLRGLFDSADVTGMDAFVTTFKAFMEVAVERYQAAMVPELPGAETVQ